MENKTITKDKEAKNILHQLDEEIKRNKQELKEVEDMDLDWVKWKTYQGTDKVIPFKKKMEDIQESIAKNGEEKSYKSGFPTIDKILGGFYEGQVISMSGETSSGKSQILIDFTKNFAKDRIPCLWFSYELSTYEFLKRFGKDMPQFSYLPNKNIESNLKWLRDRIKEAIVKYGTKIIFIDHLHYLINLKELGRGNPSLMIGEIMRELKKIAVDYGLIIFIVAHISKVPDGQKLSLSMIRDSSLITQESDIVLFIKRGREKDDNLQLGYTFTNKSVLIVAKNRRRGEVGEAKLEFENGMLKEEGIVEYNPDTSADELNESINENTLDESTFNFDK